MRPVQDWLEWRKSESRPSIQFEVTSESGFNKLGGVPQMPPHFVWPKWKGEHLLFLAQIDLSTLPRIDGVEFPDKGQLYFFYHDEQTWGFQPQDAGSAVVLYSETMDSCIVQPPPTEFGERLIYGEAFLVAHQAESFPSFEQADLGPYPDEIWDIWEEDPDPAEVQMFGWAVPVQNPEMDLESELVSNGFEHNTKPTPEQIERAKDWILLFQLGSVEEAGMCWGDVGVLYFWIRKEDLAAKRFDRIWLILQCT